DTAVASIRLANTGVVKDYVVAWTKTGIGIDAEGPVPRPRRGNGLNFRTTDLDNPGATAGIPRLFRRPDFRVTDDTLPDYMDPIRPLLYSGVSDSMTGVLGYGGRTPIYARPAGFVMRLGTLSSHVFFSGTYLS